MKRKKANMSLRTMLLLMISITIAFVCVTVLGVFRPNIINVLKNTEHQHVNELSDTLMGSIEYAIDSMRSTTRTWSSWDDVYNYISGENEKFIADNMETKTALEIYNFNFLLIHDSDGKFLYSLAYDYHTENIVDIPKGFAEALSPVSKAVFDDYSNGVRDEEEGFGKTGIFIHEGIPYLICTMPVLDTLEKKPANGTFTYVVDFSEAYLRNVTKLTTSNFKVSRCNETEFGRGDHIDVRDEGEIDFITHLRDVNGKPVSLVMNHPRIIYNNAMPIITLTSLAMFAALLIILGALYYAIQSNIIKRVMGMSEDVGSVSPDNLLNMEKFGRYHELNMLGSQINEMVLRLDANLKATANTERAIMVLQSILNSMDACLYVSDIHTDEILFINDKMKKEFGIEEDVIGQICWKVLQCGFDKRCDFCPINDLTDDDSVITWEEHNTVTNRYYRNTDRLINWPDGSKVHLQHSLDISDIKEAELEQKRQMEQQMLMANISQMFISGEDSESTVEDALSMVGDFMDADSLVIMQYKDMKADYLYEWVKKDSISFIRKGTAIDIQAEESPIVNAFLNGEINYFNSDEWKDDLFVRYDLNISSFLMFPIIVNSEFWGVLEVDRSEKDESIKWKSSDISLGSLVSSVFSGYLNSTQMKLQVKRLSSIVESSPQFISIVSKNGVVEYMNPAAKDMTSPVVDTDDPAGTHLILDDAIKSKLTNEIVPQVVQKGKLTYELQLDKNDGGSATMLFSSFLIDNNPESGIGTIARDISEMRMMEQDLRNAMEEAERSSQAKGDFLSRMSHEMRTPMNAIIGMTSIARKSDDPERKEYCLAQIDNASTHLLGVINDVLDMSKIEAHKFELSNSAFNIGKMVNGVINVIRFKTEEKKHNLQVYIDPDLPEKVYGDDQRLAQVLTNLLSNAVKFTPENGEIKLSVNLAAEEGDMLTLVISVKDNGIGMTQEQQAKLFRPFEQADGGISRKFGGTGLGLAISKHIVGLMEGDIWVESEQGTGSSFIFNIKLHKYMEKADAEAQNRNGKNTGEDPAADDFTGKRVLLAEDIEINREIMIVLLSEMGIITDEAVDGLQAVTMFENDPDRYDMILMDMQMPELDGLDATRRIRNMRFPWAKAIPIVAMTANAFKEDVERCIEAGMDDHIAKPVDTDLLQEKMQRYLR